MLRKELDARIQRLETPPPREGTPDLSVREETREALRAFGYIEQARKVWHGPRRPKGNDRPA